MNGTVLIVEDDQDISTLMARYLEREGLTTRTAAHGEEALSVLDGGGVDLVLLDINLPGIDGFEVLQSVRRTSHVPVIIVSARQEEMDAIFGLGAGADEYVTKPFSPRVLVARVRALLRRVDAVSTAAVPFDGDSRNDNDERVWLGEVAVDITQRRVTRGEQEISLAPREFAVLAFLIERNGQPATPTEIYEAVWDTAYGDVASVAVHIQRLRRKLEPAPSRPVSILTRHGYGYLCRYTTGAPGEA